MRGDRRPRGAARRGLRTPGVRVARARRLGQARRLAARGAWRGGSELMFEHTDGTRAARARAPPPHTHTGCHSGAACARRHGCDVSAGAAAQRAMACARPVPASQQGCATRARCATPPPQRLPPPCPTTPRRVVTVVGSIAALLFKQACHDPTICTASASYRLPPTHPPPHPPNPPRARPARVEVDFRRPTLP